jgi:hypothetical protein
MQFEKFPTNSDPLTAHPSIGYALGVHFMIYIEMYVIVGGGSGDVWDMFWGNEHVVRYV